MTMYYPGSYGHSKAGRQSGRRFATTFVLLMALPVAVGTGVGIDTVRSTLVQARLSRAVDEAALAGGRVFHDAQRDGHIRSFFHAAFPPGSLGANPAPLAIAADTREGTLTVSGTATVKGTFLRMLGFGDMTVEARSMVRRPGRGADPTLARVL